MESSEPWNIGSGLYKAKVGRQIKNHFSGKGRRTLKLSKNLLPILEFPINLFEVCQKPKSNLLSHGILVQGFIMPNLVDEYKTNFLEQWGKPLNSPKVFSLYWSFLEICFEVCQKLKSNLVDKYKTIFLGTRGKP